MDEVWILSGDPESFDSQGLQRRLSSLIPSSNSRWIDGSGAKARLEKFQKPSQSSSTQTDSEREEELARNLFQSQAKSVLVLGTSSPGVLGRNLMNSDGIQVLVPSTVKRDRAAIHTRNFMKTNGTRFEMDFCPDAVVYQPEYVRLIFKNDENEISRWARNGLSESAQPSLAQVYGVWLWTNKPKAVALGREL